MKECLLVTYYTLWRNRVDVVKIIYDTIASLQTFLIHHSLVICHTKLLTVLLLTMSRLSPNGPYLFQASSSFAIFMSLIDSFAKCLFRSFKHSAPWLKQMSCDTQSFMFHYCLGSVCRCHSNSFLYENVLLTWMQRVRQTRKSDSMQRASSIDSRYREKLQFNPLNSYFCLRDMDHLRTCSRMRSVELRGSSARGTDVAVVKFQGT